MTEDFRDDLRQSLKATKAQLEETSARIEEKAGRNLFLAIGTGVALAAVLILALFLSKPIFAILVAFLISLGTLELATALRKSGRRVPRVAVVISSITLAAGSYFYGAFGTLAGLAFALTLLVIWRLFESFMPSLEVPAKTLMRDVFSGLFTLVYVALLGSVALLLLNLELGQFWIFTLLTVVVFIDTGAYAAGVTLGKHKMTPRISPNKTWEGFAGAAIAGSVAAVLCAVFLLQQPWWIGLIIGLLVLLTATLGDLSESLIKRNLGIKDMSTWIPGHGGLLDRLDSVLPSTVPVYMIALLVGIG